MTTKLGIWNAALFEFGQRALSDTGEAIEPARVLAAVYDAVVEDCLSGGSWNFAMETVKADADTGVTPNFGYSEVFAKPTDWVRTYAVSEDEYFSYPLLQYYDDANYWSADTTPLYFRYVSKDTGLGLELSRWPRPFTRFVELELAYRALPRLDANQSVKDRIKEDRKEAKRAALNQDAMNDANPKFAPPGSWTRARWGGAGRDRGSRNNLTG